MVTVEHVLLGQCRDQLYGNVIHWYEVLEAASILRGLYRKST